MPESAEHILLVKALCKWITDEYLGGELGLVLSDTAGNMPAERPPKIDRYVPDVFVVVAGSPRVIVGEAKTTSDLESRHSMAQIEAFLQFCNQNRGSLLVLAIPWHRVAYMKNTLAMWSRRIGIDVSCCRVLDFLPG